jgi:hypothetical protein
LGAHGPVLEQIGIGQGLLLIEAAPEIAPMLCPRN